jgi:hypothetical protein
MTARWMTRRSALVALTVTAVVATGGGVATLASHADTATALPELVSAALGSSTVNNNNSPTVATDDFAQTTATFTFSEVVASSPTAAAFHLVGFDSNLRFDGQSAAVEGDGSTVLVTFGTSTRPVGKQQAGDIALATVSDAAIHDAAGHAGPMGSVPVGSVQTIANRAGITIGPNLQTVGNFRAPPPTDMKPLDTYADFTFDKPAYAVAGPNPGAPRLVMTDGSLITCTWSGVGAGTTTLTADCPNSSASPNISATTITPGAVVRGYVDTASVSDSAQDAVILHPQGSLNALQSASVSGPSGPAPELVGVTFVPGASAGTTLVDQVRYTFNQSVTPGTATSGTPNCAIAGGATPQVTGACFFVYNTEGVITSAANVNNSGSAVGNAPPAKSDDDPKTLVVTYPAGTLAQSVGAGIYEGGAMLAAAPNTAAHAHSIGAPNSNSTIRSPGLTVGPVLTGVGVLQNVSPPTGIYTFNMDVTQISPAATSTPKFWLEDADGTRLQCANATVASGFAPGQNNIVTCTSYVVANGAATLPSASAQQIDDAVLGVVDHGALQNIRGQQNPEGGGHTGAVPSVTAVTPSVGPESGGTKVAITGTNFFDVSGVSFGPGKAATTFTVISPTLITAKSPTHDAGQVHLIVTTQKGGASRLSANDLFTYSPKPPHPTVRHACPSARVKPSEFKDINKNPHRAAIDCLTWWGVSSGYKDNTFRPTKRVRRDQLASMIADTIRRSGGTLPKHPKDRFTDDRDNRHERDINAVAAVGVMSGFGTKFDPKGFVNRSQVAAIIFNAYRQRTKTQLPSDYEYFTDVAANDPAAREINAVAQAGIMIGGSDGRFQPGRRIRRGVAASYLTRLLDVIVRTGYAHPPA